MKESAPGGNPSGYRFRALTSALFLAFVFLPPVAAQEPGGKPDALTPKTDQVAIPLPTKSTATPPLTKSPSELDTVRDLPELATELLEYAETASCHRNGCTILVTDFVLPDGGTSRYGMQLADELSTELAARGNKIPVTNRILLHDLLAKNGVPAKSVNGARAREIASELKATLVVLGTTKRSKGDTVQLSTRLLDVADKDWRGYAALVYLPAPKSMLDFSPVEPALSLPPITTTASGEKIYRSGIDGVSSPRCRYMPNPPYSEEARKSQVNGTISVEAVIDSEGKLENVRIFRGLPGGLNEATIATMGTWKCSPALKDGKPVPTRVRFDVNFRLY